MKRGLWAFGGGVVVSLVTTLNIGGMAWRPGKKQLTKAVSLDNDDIHAFRELDKLGVVFAVKTEFEALGVELPIMISGLPLALFPRKTVMWSGRLFRYRLDGAQC